MQMCDKGHRQVVYNSDNCPMCTLVADRNHLQGCVEQADATLAEKIAQHGKQINSYKHRLAELERLKTENVDRGVNAVRDHRRIEQLKDNFERLQASVAAIPPLLRRVMGIKSSFID